MKPKNQTRSLRAIAWSRWMLCPLLASAAFAHEETVEPLASVYAVDPANPQISFDEDPYL